MKFDTILDLLAEQTHFDLSMVVQLSNEPRQTVRTQLHRWMRDGKILPLRRGMYTFAERYRRRPINPAALASDLYRPSYLSLHWALGYHGLIPEKVTVFTSVTTRSPREFTNVFGMFRYSSVKRSLFFGYDVVNAQDGKMPIATPEKALLDFWHLEKGEWALERMREMRHQNFEVVDHARLARFAGRFDSPRILRALRTWRVLAGADEGPTEL